MDFIGRLRAGEITEDEAEAQFWQLVDSWGAGAGDPADLDGFAAHMHMTRREYTAHLHGASLLEVAQLRQLGWPPRCANCGSAINYDAGYWYHPSDIEGELGWVGCIACASHPAQEVVPRTTD